MDCNIEFLNYIYQNSEMGKDTIKQLLGIVKDEAFKQTLESQLKEYNEIYDISNDKIKQAETTSKGIGTMTKMRTYLMINVETLIDKTPSHIAEMMIQGSSMGIVDVTKKLKKYNEAAKDITALGDRLLKFEQENVEEMKKFL